MASLGVFQRAPVQSAPLYRSSRRLNRTAGVMRPQAQAAQQSITFSKYHGLGNDFILVCVLVYEGGGGACFC
eukprot:1154489-Pelagomonas_calceolata.AAC.2